MKILLVEDEIDLLEMMTEICESLGYQTHGFTKPVEALEFLNRNSNSAFVMVSDYNLPEMNGFEMMLKVRARHPDTPFIFWSGFWEESLRELILSNQAVNVLDKPFDMRAFRTLISKIIRSKEAVSELQIAA